MATPATPSVPPKEQLRRIVDDLPTDPGSPYSPAVQKAVELARRLQTRGVDLQTPQERRQQRELERMLAMPEDKVTMVQMTDQAFRSHNSRRAANQLIHILDVQGVPRFFGTFDRAMLRGFQSFGGFLPGTSMPMVKEKMREETANVVLPAEPELLIPHLETRREGGLRMNVNYLGEALLGEEDARRRLDRYLAALQIPEIEVISVKISTIYSQLAPIARETSVEILAERLELLFRAAAKARFHRADGVNVPKFVYLDMEEYRDLDITVEAFMRTLEQPGLEQASAGIALQAYVPDSDGAQRTLLNWAKARVAAGKAPVTMRIVKGANMEMERVEASLMGWPQAPYTNKIDTDANYKRMLARALEPENARAIHVGVASHNLFDVAYALVLGVENDVLDCMQFEMLEGMANHQRRALEELAPSMLLYAPATYKAQFVNAIGYLIRRLDENTGPENFLRHAFKLEAGSPEWKELEQGFLASCDRVETVADHARRVQDRHAPFPDGENLPRSIADFVNEPDTDFSLAQNVRWADEILDEWGARCGSAAPNVPVVVAGAELAGDREVRECYDPSRPNVVVSRYAEGTEADLSRALKCAVDDPSGWRRLTDDDRAPIMGRVAHQLQQRRADLMGAALVEGGKLLTESDPEVSEAIDFVNYYAVTARALRALPTLHASPKGVVAVVTPWNFPIAIPCGGVAAALATGNTVILKPAPETVLIAYELCKCFWDAGVPREALQFLPCGEVEVASKLVAAREVDAVVFTGGTDTALKMLAAKADMNLLAETGGKNATIVTSMSDRELAVKHVVQSAFGHSGQKCSATSLLVLEAEVYDDPEFRDTLCDAVKSLKVGSAWDLATRVGPLINAPSGHLDRALHELEPGESWAVHPRRVEKNPNLWSPGVKWGVEPGSYTHRTEFFGPVLAVIRADDLDDAIAIVNETGFGLTSGIESLDSREKEIWKERVRAGNLYVNRGTTGAIVQRQPFGGMGKSAFGPGIKAGGPNYVAQLMNFSDSDQELAHDARMRLGNADLQSFREAIESGVANRWLDDDQRRLLRAISSYDQAYSDEFGIAHDDVKLVGQDNIRRYLPLESVRVRIHPDDTAFEVLARVCATRAAGARVIISSNPGAVPILRAIDELTESWGAGVEFVEESTAALADAIKSGQVDRLRYAARGRVPDAIRQAIGESGVYIADAPVLAEGRIELIWYLREQSISDDYHRYGNLGDRGDEKRRPVL